MHIKYLLFAMVLIVVVIPVQAADDFMLAYYVEIGKGGEKFVLQQHGQRLNQQRGVSTPVGRGGRGKFSLRLASVSELTGVLRLEYFDDTPSTTGPVYSKDIEFSTEGARGELVEEVDNVSVELSYSIVAK